MDLTQYSIQMEVYRKQIHIREFLATNNQLQMNILFLQRLMAPYNEEYL